ncbi:hypothetical protein IWQ60_000331 [Tieghemiomyces parasiticus]|uniref:Uncharacterized protein n=1 Tax=Tieghemiomyces parasiticus TaxID=78921 RepID=A0A9W8ALC1_9FUNG|nr:hypothetical protein IWQ60_000331 [Tieghemiomyces parasiticus]
MNARQDYDVISSRPEALTKDETELLLDTIASMIPVPALDEVEDSYIDLPKPVVCVSYCQNPKDVAAAAAENLSIIHIPAQCQPLQRQVKQIKSKLDKSRKVMCTSLTQAGAFALLAYRRDLVCDVARWVADQAPVFERIANYNLYNGYRTRDVAVGAFAVSTLAGAVGATMAHFQDGIDGWSNLNSYEVVPVKVQGKEDLYLVHKEHKARSQAKSNTPLAVLAHNPLTTAFHKVQGSNIPMVVYSTIVAALLTNGIKNFYR